MQGSDLQALRDSEQWYRTIVETSHEGVWVLDGDAVTVYVNRRMHEMLGYGPAEMIGRHLFDFMDAAGREQSTRNLERRAKGIAEDHEFRFLRRDGSALWTLVSTTPLREPTGRYTGALAMVMDISERKRAEEALRDSERRLQYALEATAEGSWDWNIKTGVVHFSPNWAESLGYAPEEVPPTVDFWKSLVHPDDRPRTLEAVQAHLDRRTEICECENRLRTKSGAYRDNLDRGKVVEWDQDGSPLRMVGTDTDITQRKRSEDARRRVEARLQQTQKLEGLGVLAGGIAHDFNNLLMAIIGHTDLALLDLPVGSPVWESVTEALNAARRAAELTKQMLAYSGRGTFMVEPLNLSRLIKEMDRLLQVSISKKCVVRCRLRDDLPAIEADAAQVRQVVMNLILNASEAIDQPGGVIAITTGVSHCDRAFLADPGYDQDLPEGLYVWLEVADTGIGMSEETRARIFDPFFTTKFTGRGLGLAAVLGIMRGHRGAVICSSEPGKGSTFKVLFPATATPANASRPPAPGGTAWRGSGTVLVVDDEESVRSAARRMLTGMGFTVLLAKDGREGVEVLRSEGQRIRLVLLDMTMPRLDGAGALLEMRRLRSDVKVILSSGYAEDVVTKSRSGEAPTAFIQKPYGVDQLTTVVRRVLDSGGILQPEG